jgi:hypothetical protein
MFFHDLVHELEEELFGIIPMSFRIPWFQGSFSIGPSFVFAQQDEAQQDEARPMIGILFRHWKIELVGKCLEVTSKQSCLFPLPEFSFFFPFLNC